MDTDARAIADYCPLLQRFLDGELTAEEFQTRYLDMYLNDERFESEELFLVLDRLFGDVDAFCPDPELRAGLNETNPGFYIDAEELRGRVAQTVEQLHRLSTS